MQPILNIAVKAARRAGDLLVKSLSRLDSLDGTSNFLHGNPVFSVSIAFERRGRLEHAVVYDPMRQEFFTASRGEGAQVEGRRMRVSKQKELEGSLIGTGFPYRANAKWI